MVRAARLRAAPQRGCRAPSKAPSQAEVGSRFEVIVFTASLAKYADPLLDLLDRGSCVRWRLFRESCYPYEGNYVKDLTCLGRPLKDVIIVDNSPHSYIFHPFNAVRRRRGFPLPRARAHARRIRSAGAHLEFYRRHVGARFAGPAAAHAEPGGGGGRHHGHCGDVLARRDADSRQIAAYYARCSGAIKRVELDGRSLPAAAPACPNKQSCRRASDGLQPPRSSRTHESLNHQQKTAPSRAFGAADCA